MVTCGVLLAGCGSNSTNPANSKGGASTSSQSNSSDGTGKPLDIKAYDDLIKSGPVADDSTVTANKWASQIKKNGTLKVGAVKTSTLFSLQSPDDGKLRGFDAGLSQLLARYIIGDAKTTVSVVDSSTREAVLQNGTVDSVFATYSITDERKQKIDFSDPYYTSKQGIMVRSDDNSIASVNDLAGKRVGIQQGSTGSQILKKYAPKANGLEFQTDAEIVQALKQKRVDAYVINESLLLGDVAKDPKSLKVVGKTFGTSDPNGIGLPKGSDATKFVNAWLKKVKEDGTWAKLWKLTIGERTGVTEVPTPPEADGKE